MPESICKPGENKFFFGNYEIDIYFTRRFIFSRVAICITWHRKNNDDTDSYSSSCEGFNWLSTFSKAYKHIKEMEAKLNG